MPSKSEIKSRANYKRGSAEYIKTLPYVTDLNINNKVTRTIYLESVKEKVTRQGVFREIVGYNQSGKRVRDSVPVTIKRQTDGKTTGRRGTQITWGGKAAFGIYGLGYTPTQLNEINRRSDNRFLRDLRESVSIGKGVPTRFENFEYTHSKGGQIGRIRDGNAVYSYAYTAPTAAERKRRDPFWKNDSILRIVRGDLDRKTIEAAVKNVRSAYGPEGMGPEYKKYQDEAEKRARATYASGKVLSAKYAFGRSRGLEENRSTASDYTSAKAQTTWIDWSRGIKVTPPPGRKVISIRNFIVGKG